ncbi:MAG: hypothetical protein KIS81_03395 [Maricaulaceae bacterium]|nr:hypothetical protein [Maricaulaceae bacterium]
MIRRLFTEHPASVGEGYFEHMGQAFSFAGALFAAGFVCAVHAIFPFLFQKTGSQAICRLHERMVSCRDKRAGQESRAGVEPASSR